MARLSASRRRRIEDGGGSRHHSFCAADTGSIGRCGEDLAPRPGDPPNGLALKSELTPRQPTRIGSTCSIDRRWLSRDGRGASRFEVRSTRAGLAVRTEELERTAGVNRRPNVITTSIETPGPSCIRRRAAARQLGRSHRRTTDGKTQR